MQRTSRNKAARFAWPSHQCITTLGQKCRRMRMSRQHLARTAALFYVLNFVLGTLALMWTQKGQTAAADQVTLLAAADYAVVALLLGLLFQPAGRALSWTVAIVGLAGCALSTAAPLHLFTSPVNALAVFGL